MTTRRTFLGAAAGFVLHGSTAPANASDATRSLMGDTSMQVDLILFNGKISTLDRQKPEASALLIRDGRFAAVGDEQEVMPLAGPTTQRIDLKGRRVIPGLIRSAERRVGKEFRFR